MASKMPAARDANGNRITIEMAENGSFEKPLKCEFCDASVSFVNGHPREVGEDIVFVEPFFRLAPKSTHHEGCNYNSIGQLTVIARESDGDVFMAISNNQFELRLLAVKKALDQLIELAKTKKSLTDDKKLISQQKEYIASEEKLGAYINSAKRVLKVRSVCEDHAEIENLLTLVFDGVSVPWSDFYFEDTDYFRCYRQLKSSTTQIPIAVHGTIKSIKTVPGKKENFSVVNLVRPMRNIDKADAREVACTSIWAPDVNFFSDYREGQTIIAFGMWQWKPESRIANSKANSPIKTFVNYEMRLWPVAKSQICAA